MKLTKSKPAGLILPTIAFTAAAALSVTTSNAALLFYENFSGYTAGPTVSLNGQGGWSSPSNSFEVRSGTINDGGSGSWNGTIADSSTSGGNFIAPDFGGTVGLANITLASTVTNSFSAGTTTWLSYVEYNGNDGAAGRQNLAIGAAPLTGLDAGITGGGIGVATTNNNTPRAAYWTTTAEVADSASSVSTGRPIFVVAKIQWGSAPASLDQITVKRFLDGSVTETEFNTTTQQSVASFALDQSTFDTLSIASRYAWFDDIRIANDFDSAISGTNVIPEPTAALLGVIGCSLLVLRRRR